MFIQIKASLKFLIQADKINMIVCFLGISRCILLASSIFFYKNRIIKRKKQTLLSQLLQNLSELCFFFWIFYYNYLKEDKIIIMSCDCKVIGASGEMLNHHIQHE